MKYSIVTFGCRVNQADSLGFEEGFRAEGATPASTADADVVVVNTCSVTSTADQGARQTIRRIARANPGARIVVTGCYATRRPDEVGALPHVVQVVRNDDKPRLISIVRGADVDGVRRVRLQPDLSNPALDVVAQGFSPATTTAERFGNGDGGCGASIEPGVAGRTAFTLRVQTGCAESCSYCIIPQTRGRPRSVAVDQILAEVARVVTAGYKEIALTGVHLGSYGRDLTPQSSLTGLLRRLAETSFGATSSDWTERPLFRISSLEPNDCASDVVDLVATSGCFAPHFHLPLQHASNRVLEAMRRPYTIDQYATLVDEIRRRIPHASIGSDVIVGFPGEKERDFEQLAAYLERSPLTHVHVFPYSDRPGTVASGMKDRVPGLVVRERGRRIRDISASLAKAFLGAQVGTVHRALTLEDGSLAVTGNYLKVRIAPGRARNEWIDVRITSAAPLMGDLTT